MFKTHQTDSQFATSPTVKKLQLTPLSKKDPRGTVLQKCITPIQKAYEVLKSERFGELYNDEKTLKKILLNHLKDEQQTNSLLKQVYKSRDIDFTALSIDCIKNKAVIDQK